MVLLIHPPVCKPGEPPAGIAKLAGVLKHHGIRFNAVDMNLETLTAMPAPDFPAEDTWSRRAYRHRFEHLDALTRWPIYSHMSRYRRAVGDINRLLSIKGQSTGVHLSLNNYDDPDHRAVSSRELIQAAEFPEKNLFYDYFSTRLTELMDLESPGLVGVSLNFMSQAACTFAMTGFLKRRFPGIKIVLGGGLVTSWIRRPSWKNPFRGLVDDMIAGPGEGPLLNMLGKADSNPCHLPDYTPFTDGRYLAPGRILPYSASTGCYWNRCRFCPEKAENTPYQPISPATAAQQILTLADTCEPTLIHMTDNAVSPAVMKALVALKQPVPWYGFARFTRHLLDPDFCRELKRSGCVMLKLGVESGSQKVLDELEKGVKLDMMSAALKQLKAAGIAAFVYLLFGTPAESPEEALQTLDFTVRHHDCISFLNLAVFNLPVFAPDTARLKTDAFYEGDLQLYRQFTHPGGWDRLQVRRFLDRQFKKHPAVAPILRNLPPHFSSNHAPLFVMARSQDTDGRQSTH